MCGAAEMPQMCCNATESVSGLECTLQSNWQAIETDRLTPCANRGDLLSWWFRSFYDEDIQHAALLRSTSICVIGVQSFTSYKL